MLIPKNGASNITLQENQLLKEFLTWKEKHEQVDVVCIVGVKF
jgi:hypothetical protein